MSDSDVDDDAEVDAEVERHANERKVILDFLSGLLVRKPNIFQEDAARRLLAEQFRNDNRSVLDPQIRWRLAALIEPYSSGSFRDKNGRWKLRSVSDWMLIIKPRPRDGREPRRLPERARDKEIALHVAGWLHHKKQMKWAVDKVGKQFGVKDRTVRNAWHKYGGRSQRGHREQDSYQLRGMAVG
jgi:hypothetical protein